jgi:dihydroceramidase
MYRFEDQKYSVYGWKLPALLTAVSAAISAIYITINNPIFHQFCFGVLITIMAVRAGYKYRRLPSSETKNTLHRMFITSWSLYATGFLVWNIDNQFCPQLRAIRASVGAPFDALFQLHGWWHIFTALGSFAFIVSTQYHRLLEHGKENEYMIEWTIGIFPRIVARNNKAKLL